MVIGKKGRNIEGLKAIPGISYVRLTYSSKPNTPRILTASGTPQALQIVRENVKGCLQSSAWHLSNKSRQHHTHDLVSGRLLAPADVHPEIRKTKRKPKPGSRAEKQSRDKERKKKEAAAAARIAADRDD
eukprot:gene22516-25086_t